MSKDRSFARALCTPIIVQRVVKQDVNFTRIRGSYVMSAAEDLAVSVQPEDPVLSRSGRTPLLASIGQSFFARAVASC